MPAPPADRLAALVAEVAADGRPAQALLARMTRLRAAGDAESLALAAALFESVHYRLTPFVDDALPEVAGTIYARIGKTHVGMLLADLARQLVARPSGERRASEAVEAMVDAIAAQFEPGAAMVRALESQENDPDGSVELFEAVWRRGRTLRDYWVYHRMSDVYLAVGRDDAAALMATLAIQILPAAITSDMPHRRLLAYFQAAGRVRDAAELVTRRHALCSAPELITPAELAALCKATGPLTVWPPPRGRRDRLLIAADTRPPQTWRTYNAGGNTGRFDDDAPHDNLRDLGRELRRDPIVITELDNADVLIDGDGVGVFGPDGTPHTDLSTRFFPALLSRQLAAKRAAGTFVEEIEAATAVMMCDEYPGPNLCHYLLDHAPRLALYRQAGVNVSDAVVIGPAHRTDYQHLIAPKLGLRTLIPTTRPAHVRVGRLVVSSNCSQLMHPAHWTADWALAVVRDLFDLAPRAPRRRLLISRADTRARRLANEAELTEFLRPHDFEVIVPGHLPFTEQVAMFRDATHIVASHGAALANILFCQPGTHVLEAFHPHYGTWAYAMLSGALRLDYASMVGRDGDSDAPAFNDRGLDRRARSTASSRHVRVDLDELARWLRDTGAWSG